MNGGVIMKKKRLLSLAMAVAMIFGSVATLPEGTFTHSTSIRVSAENAPTSGKCGENVYWSLDDKGVLTISGTGKMTDYYGENKSPFYNREDIKSVVIKSGVTSIGDYAFCECSSLKSITIPNSVTSIGDSAFGRCYNLTSVTIPNSVTSIGDSAFWCCTSLSSISMPSNVTSIGNGAFYECKSLTSITIPSSVTRIGAFVFSGCSSLTSITIPNSVTSIGDYAFSRSGLKSITIPNSVTSIGSYAFHDCENLLSITIPNSVKSIGGNVFYGTKWLENQHKKNPLVVVNGILIDGTKCSGKVTVPSSVKSIGDEAFGGCENLTSITIPSSVKSIEKNAFLYCTNLSSVTIPSSVTSIGDYAFQGCVKLTSITIPGSVTSIGNEAFLYTQWLENQQKKNPLVVVNGILIDGTKCSGNVTIPSSVTSIGDNAFASCEKLTSMTIPNSVTSIGDNAFCDCSSLSSVNIPSSVTSIGGNAFLRTKWLENQQKKNPLVVVNGILIDGTKCSGKVDIPNSVTSIGNSAFNLCVELTSVTIPNSVTSIGDYAFNTCLKLTSVTIPNSVTSIGDYAFGYSIFDIIFEKDYDFVIKGYKGTTAEKYAKDNEFKFVSLGTIEPTITRLAGAGRYATAAAISQAAFDKADTVILAYSMNYADALAGVPLAYQKNAPILLTNTKELDSATLAEIKRLGAKKVILLGGEGAIGKEVETALVKGGIAKDNIKRIAGKSRFSTATAIASQLNEKPTDVFFVYYNGFADALSASTVAARKTAPIIYLTTNGELDADTAKYLKSIKGSVKNAYVIGGEGVISNDMATKAAKALGLSKATRVAGADRFATCVEVNKQFAGDLNGDMICVATGMNFPDALAGGVYAAKNSAPLFLINGNAKTPNLNDAQKAYLKGKNAANITAFGGEGVVPDSHIADIAKNSI